VVEFVGRKPES